MPVFNCTKKECIRSDKMHNKTLVGSLRGIRPDLLHTIRKFASRATEVRTFKSVDNII